MVNQPIGGCQGSFIDVKIQAAEQNRNLKVAQHILHNNTGRTMDECAEVLDRETFLCAFGGLPSAFWLRFCLELTR